MLQKYSVYAEKMLNQVLH